MTSFSPFKSPAPSDRFPTLTQQLAAQTALDRLNNAYNALEPKLKTQNLPHLNRLTDLFLQAQALADKHAK